MAEPKKKLSRTRSGNRRSHDFLKKIDVGVCPKCKANILPHHVCQSCGYYNNEKVLKIEKERLAEVKQKEELQDE
ncbi:MAG: 50S ribosomal protein L32 [candidate division WS2 bacterium ADurb.Bin280]|uniref:Large ribosomal subunit protein bL32 n=1 Tax=candidate division WS2 bacterium ADurb.Bin280 TaxID=1852829 RepID=A0A1V5SD53_9BACT|nr:MAG: 50S ribosomal protein L32 [candidate division WS2 bacterium ADurb.Bin280]